MKTQAIHLDLLYKLCDKLITMQITNPADTNAGALISPNTNPDKTPIHTRAAEAVFPLSVAYKHSQNIKYLESAVRLGNWLIRNQKFNGSWKETPWRWKGTTADQCLAMADAYSILKNQLSLGDQVKWEKTIQKAADWIINDLHYGFCPLICAPVNYKTIRTIALQAAYEVLPLKKTAWTRKARKLALQVLAKINDDNFLSGEGKYGEGVDLGYNISHSLGNMAYYALRVSDIDLRKRIAELMDVHLKFVYPNGSIDNSWGTRSFKWTYEGGTKTAHSAIYSLALLKDLDPRFHTAELLCLDYLANRAFQDGWITSGPSASKHDSTFPPSNYLTVARLCAMATAIEYGPNVSQMPGIPAQQKNWINFFPSVNVAVVRTNKIMATVSAYGQIKTYGRDSVPKGGSITNLWFEGFGELGYLQTSSQTRYVRHEAMHMPIEDNLLPLTPRIECFLGNIYYTNLYDADIPKLVVQQQSDCHEVVATGKLTSRKGAHCGIQYRLVHKFYADYVKKEITVEPSNVSTIIYIIEPIVNDRKTSFVKIEPGAVRISPASGNRLLFRVTNGTQPYLINLGLHHDKYWCPFPGIECFPVSIEFDVSEKPAQLHFTLGM